MVSATTKKEMDTEQPRRWKQKPDQLYPDQGKSSEMLFSQQKSIQGQSDHVPEAVKFKKKPKKNLKTSNLNWFY